MLIKKRWHSSGRSYSSPPPTDHRDGRAGKILRLRSDPQRRDRRPPRNPHSARRLPPRRDHIRGERLLVLYGDQAERRALVAPADNLLRLQPGLLHGAVLSHRGLPDAGSDRAPRRGRVPARAAHAPRASSPRLHPCPRPVDRGAGRDRERTSIPGDASLARSAWRDHSGADVVRRGATDLLRGLCRVARRGRPAAARESAAVSVEPRPRLGRPWHGRGRVPFALALAGRRGGAGAPVRLFRELRGPVPRRLSAPRVAGSKTFRSGNS